MLIGLKESQGNENVLYELRKACEDIRSICRREQDCVGSLPDHLQCSKRADEYNDNISNLEAAMSDMKTLVDIYETSDNHLWGKAQQHVVSVINNCIEVIER